MTSLVKQIKEELHRHTVPGKKKDLARFFKTGPGEYGEGDKFLGITVPDQRKVAQTYKNKIQLNDAEKLLQSEIHEYRLTALFLLIHLYNKSDTDGKKVITDTYLANLKYVNNWDLVDSSAEKILGDYLYNYNNKKTILYSLVKSTDLWEQRVSIIATFYFIKKNDYKDTLKISKILLNHEHDLIHKAVGWMLREVGNRDFDTEVKFLNLYYKKMPRTMLRYAIEKFNEPLRKKYLKGEI